MTSLLVFVIMSLHGFMASGYDLRDITSLVFGKDENSFVPAAFGDFNSDKLTDIFVLKEDGKSVAVLLASEQNVVSVDSSPVFQYQQNMHCGCPGGESSQAALTISSYLSYYRLQILRGCPGRLRWRRLHGPDDHRRC